MLCIAMVANEASGDLLGAALLRQLRARHPDLECFGVGGDAMQAAGCTTLFPLERLSVMGLTEVLAHLPELLRLRRTLYREILARRPRILIGIDAPDFNLGLERRVRRQGILAAHLVSPTVWAWRPGRVKALRRSVDLLLSILPFEEPFLRAHGVPVVYVGHPLADEFPLAVDQEAARAALGLPAAGTVIALLPGSRVGEVARLGAPFIDAARRCLARQPGLRFAAPMASPALRQRFEQDLRMLAPELPITLVDGRSREVLAAADLVLTASGTATLEALLSKRPMVVGYRLHPLTYALVKGLNLIKVPHVAMANLLAEQRLAPELLQGDCTGERLAEALLEFLDHPERCAAIRAEYQRLHAGLRHDAAAAAARAVLQLLAERAG